MEPTTPLPELLIRGTVIYFVVMGVLRILPKRSIGNNSPVDMLALVVVGALAADSMSVGAEAPVDFLVLAGVVAAWGYVVNLLEYRFPFLTRLTDEAPRVIVRDGRRLPRAMRKELITEAELIACIRSAGLDDVSEVACATVETTGEISLQAKKDGKPGNSSGTSGAEGPAHGSDPGGSTGRKAQSPTGTNARSS